MPRYISAQRNLSNVLGGLKDAHKAEKRFIPRRIKHAKSIGANVGLFMAHQAGGKVKTKVADKIVDRTTRGKGKESLGADTVRYKNYHKIGEGMSEERLDEIWSLLARGAASVGGKIAGSTAGKAVAKHGATAVTKGRNAKAGYLWKKRGVTRKVKAVKTAATNTRVGQYATKKMAGMERKARAKNIARIRLRRTSPIQAAVRDTGREIAKDVTKGVAVDSGMRTANHHIKKKQEAKWNQQKQATNAARSPYQQRRESARSILAFLREEAPGAMDKKPVPKPAASDSLANAHVARQQLIARNPKLKPSGGVYKVPDKTKTNTRVSESVTARAERLHEAIGVGTALTAAFLAKPAYKVATAHIRAGKKIGKKVGGAVAHGIKKVTE